MRQTSIDTARLRLRALAAGDLTLLQELYCDAETMRHIRHPLSPAQVKASLHATLDAAQKPHGTRFFVITERRSRHAIGLCSMQAVARRERSVEMGIMLVPRACRLGYAREAFSVLIAAAFMALPIDTIWVQHTRANVAAARLNDALGFRLARRMRPRGASPGQCVWILRRAEQRNPSHQPTRGEAMSNIIGFLENAGSNAALRHVNREQLLRAMRNENLAPTLQAALLNSGRSQIDTLLGVRDTLYCSNFPVKPPKKAPPKKKPVKAPPKKTPAKKPAKKAPAKRGG